MASEVTEQAKQTTSQAAERARTAATENGAKVIARGRVAVDRQTMVAGERVNTVAQRARLTAAELRRQGEETPAKLADQAADRAQQFGDWLKAVDADQLTSYAQRYAAQIQPGKAISAVEGFARKQPLLALVAGAAPGFLVARLLKASSTKRYAASNPQPGLSSPTPVSTPEFGAPTGGNGGLTEGTTSGTFGTASPGASFGTGLESDRVDVVDTPITDAPIQSTPLTSEPLTSAPLQSEPLADDADITWRGTVDPPR